MVLSVGVQGEMVYSLLSILGTHNREDMSHTLLAMSTSSDSCLAMRQSGTFTCHHPALFIIIIIACTRAPVRPSL